MGEVEAGGQSETFVAIQVRDDGGSDQSGRSRDGGNGHSGYIPKVKISDFPVKLEMGYDRKRVIKDDSVF